MKRLFAPLAAFVVMMGLASDVLAIPYNGQAAASDGSTAVQMATYLYCGTKGILQGYIGLLIGLALVGLGLWALIQGRGLTSGLTLIVFGSLVTALPSIVESTMGGLGDLLTQAGITNSGAGFQGNSCGQVSVPPVDNSGYDGSDYNNLAVVKEYGKTLPKPDIYQAPQPYAP